MILGYVRVSSTSQIAGTSLAEQTRKIRAIAMAEGLSDYDVVIFQDEAESGSIPLAERPEGAKLLSQAKRGDKIVATKLDRAFRDACDALMVFNHCKREGIDLVLYDLGTESVTQNGVSKLLFTILS